MSFVNYSLNPPHGVLTHAPMTYVLPLPQTLSEETLKSLAFFKVTLPMVIQYVLGIWHIFDAQDERRVAGYSDSAFEMVYDYTVEAISSRTSIFYYPDRSTRDDTYYLEFENLMEIIYTLMDSFKRGLSQLVRAGDEADLTEFQYIRMLGPHSIVVAVQQKYGL